MWPQALQAIGCLELRTAGKQILTTLLQDFEKQVAPYLLPPAPDLELSTAATATKSEGDLSSAGRASGLVDWRVSGWLALADYALNGYYTVAQLNALTSPSKGKASLAQTCLPQTTGSPKCLEIPPGLPALPVTFENITLSVALKDAHFSGLDTVELWQWLVPSTGRPGGRSSAPLLSDAGIANMSAKLVLDTTVSIRNTSTLRVPTLALPRKYSPGYAQLTLS